MTPFFSIIVPVYNVAPYLRECLDSVLAQTFADWECICVDDGSTDGSGGILDEYAAKDSRFRVFHQTNAGVSAARNKGLDEISASIGEEIGYVWFVDSDDSINPDSLFWLHDTIIQHGFPSSFSFLRSAVIEAEQSPHSWPKLPPPSDVEVFHKINGRVVRSHRTAVWGAIVNRKEVCKYRFENYAIGEDVLFIAEVLWNSTGPWISAEASLYFYRKRSDSAMNSAPSAKTVIDECTTNRKLLELISANSDKWSFRDMKDFLDWNSNFVWLMHNGRIFRLTTKREMNLALPAWCSLQLAQQRLRPEGHYRRFVVWLLGKVPNGYLCELLVRKIPRWAKWCANGRWRALLWHGVVLGVKSVLPDGLYRWVHRRVKGESG